VERSAYYIKVIVPLAIEQAYTYSVPDSFREKLRFGVRVEVQFGAQRHYTALVVELDVERPSYPVKDILDVLDIHPVIHPHQYPFWQWIASYYMSPLGDVMNAALPASLKLTSETMLLLNRDFDGDTLALGDDAYLVAEALQISHELSLDEVRKILQRKSVYPVIQELIECDFLIIKEELKERYKPKKEDYLRLLEPYHSDSKSLHQALDLTKRSEKQTNALLAVIREHQKGYPIPKLAIQKSLELDSSVWTALQKKGIVEIFTRTKSRLGEDIEASESPPPFSEQQQQAWSEIRDLWREKRVVLLHGVTGSGKTRVYVEWIREIIQSGRQALYLLPEIALTTHLIHRLKKLFGSEIGIYHSGLNNNERAEMWRAVRGGLPVVLGARSALFLPFENLGGIVVDEEHDPSYKQTDPSPRYHTRDAAVYLAGIWDVKVLLGSATPAVETFHNAQKGKYGYVAMSKRFGDLQPPELRLVDTSEAHRRKKMRGHFSQELLDAMELCLREGKQVLIFRNRRGYAPALSCSVCGWCQHCANCDVAMTYHRHQAQMRCHYCGYRSRIPPHCPACGSDKLDYKGYGTEQIEEELKELLPGVAIGRLDSDTVRTRNAYERIFDDFETGKTRVLVGTQMLSKGLDFENVRLVGVLNAEQSLYFPDFRATERTFQLLTQVSGRAGRKHSQGRVIIQSQYLQHPIFELVQGNDYAQFFRSEIAERRDSRYPPFVRLVRISLKHPKAPVVYQAAELLRSILEPVLGKMMLGPAAPAVSRVRNQYLQDLIVKLGRNHQVAAGFKQQIREAALRVNKTKGFSQVRINMDVDPMG